MINNLTMDKLFINLTDKNSVTPDQKIEKAMFRHFPDAVNIEWFCENGAFETIFHLDNMEYIAHFDSAAKLLDYRVNLPLNMLPDAIGKSLDPEKELMNLVEIHKGNSVFYEIILRNKELVRFVALYTYAGDKLEEKKL